MKNQNRHRNDRGSALLVSLMVMVGLSLLGLGFVAISETESAISVNERNYVQTLHVAEAGARTVAQWFNDPEWALENKLMPANTNGIKQKRENNSIAAGSSAEYYKFSTSTDLLCDIPFNKFEDKFYGVDASAADIVINSTTAATFLNNFNTYLFKDNREGGRVVEIRIYGPPVVAGEFTTAASGLRFWNHDKGTRYGLATIAVTAEKTKDGTATGAVISRRTVRIVVAEFPLPGADGPLQSGEGTGTTGNFRVHWGKAISNQEIAVKRLNTSLPWLNAWNIIPYERGYAPEHAVGTDNYLIELNNKEFEDPWFWVSARGTASAPAGSPATSGTDQLWLYTSANSVENAVGNAGYSGHFQNQNQDVIPTRRNTIFTRPVYDVWKQIALAGAGQQGVYYLRYDAATTKWYDMLGDSRFFHKWVNTKDGGEEGYFFFDTTTGANPQNADGTTNTGILAPAVALTSAQGNPFLMRGFFYMNIASFGTSGIQAGGRYCNFPGEPFRDVGYQKVNTTNFKLMCTNPLGGNVPVDCDAAAVPPRVTPFKENETNDVWDYLELNGNGKFDYVVQKNPADITGGTDTGTIAADTEWFIRPYYEGCTIGTNCSEPHEPYLNVIYPDPAGSPAKYALKAGNDPEPVRFRWQDPTAQQRLAKKQNPNGTLVSCAGTPSDDDCTSNRYDRRGPLTILGSQTSDGPVMEGVIFNEGSYNAAGNATYYGALLFQGTVSGSGTPFVFFDDSLATGEWAEKFENMPRTIITTIETDQ